MRLQRAPTSGKNLFACLEVLSLVWRTKPLPRIVAIAFVEHVWRVFQKWATCSSLCQACGLDTSGKNLLLARRFEFDVAYKTFSTHCGGSICGIRVLAACSSLCWACGLDVEHREMPVKYSPRRTQRFV